jgi:chloramphenicol 3-O-phosphotransferase
MMIHMTSATSEPQIGRVVMVSGPVAAGKTTVARLLLPLLQGHWAYLDGDTFWSFIAKADKRSPRENFQVIMRSMTAAAVPFARSGFSVLLDFSIPPNFLPTARKILKEIPLDFVSLRPSVELCARRAAERSEGKVDDYAPYRSFYALFENAGTSVISDDEATAETLAARLREGLASGLFSVSTCQ